MTAGRVLAYSGLGLTVVMLVLTMIGTTNHGLYYAWCLLAAAGVGAFAFGRKLDSSAAKRNVASQEWSGKAE